MTEASHEPVLMKEVMDALALSPGDAVVDATLGGAGHFRALLASLGEGGVIVGIDADPEALARAREAYGQDRRPERPVAHLVNDNFRNLARVLERLGVAQVDAILFDLGWSGYQLTALRGFSFSHLDEPLLMTYGLPAQTGEGERAGQTAAEILNSATEDALAEILLDYGEERFARAIAREVVHARQSERILTVGQLVSVVAEATPVWYQKRRTHPATKTFQALRIAVNDELGALQEGLAAALASLVPGGRLAVITFHSIEDRVVKQALRKAEVEGVGAVLKRPIVASRAEVAKNRRARSAKLRVFVRSGTSDVPSVGMSDVPGASQRATPLLSYV